MTDKSINNNITEIKTEEFHSEDSNEIVMEEAEPKSDLPIISGELYYTMPCHKNKAMSSYAMFINHANQNKGLTKQVNKTFL